MRVGDPYSKFAESNLQQSLMLYNGGIELPQSRRLPHRFGQWNV